MEFNFYFIPWHIVVFWFFGSYLAGSIPFGLLMAKWVGAGDIRGQGSGNIGATNVMRVAGRKPAAVALLLDMAKGFIPVWWACRWYGGTSDLVFGVALAAFLGHLFPIFLGFKGGKGVATGLGIFLAWTPGAALAAVLIWILVAFLLRFSSLASLMAFAWLPALIFYTGSMNAVLVSAIMTPMVLWRHRSNILRLIQGTEPRIGKKGT
ncbi:MAG: glycerol-3-phosphate 1-O-acyltransferase PlsY [Magnetococcus sp. DMHC-6]